jgi:hypothetical protein
VVLLCVCVCVDQRGSVFHVVVAPTVLYKLLVCSQFVNWENSRLTSLSKYLNKLIIQPDFIDRNKKQNVSEVQSDMFAMKNWGCVQKAQR